MLTGVVLGAIIMLLLFAVFYLLGSNRAIRAYADKVDAEATNLAAQADAAQANLQQLAAKVQEMQQPVIINMTDKQAVDMASILAHRMKMIYTAEQDAALKKLS